MGGDKIWRLDFHDDRFNEVDVDVEELETESTKNKGKHKLEENVEKVNANSYIESYEGECPKMKKLLNSMYRTILKFFH